MSSRRLDFKEYEKRISAEGLSWEMKQQFEKALKSYASFLKEVEAISPMNDEETKAKQAIKSYLLMRKANIIMQKGDIERGRQLMDKASEEAEKSENPLMIGRSKLGLGVFLGSTGSFDEAERLLKEALSMFKKGKNYDSLQSVGWCLLNLGGLYGKMEKYNEANESLSQAIGTLKEIENWVGMATAFELRARTNQARGHIKLANEDFRQAIEFYEKQGMTEKADTVRDSIVEKP